MLREPHCTTTRGDEGNENHPPATIATTSVTDRDCAGRQVDCARSQVSLVLRAACRDSAAIPPLRGGGWDGDGGREADGIDVKCFERVTHSCGLEDGGWGAPAREMVVVVARPACDSHVACLYYKGRFCLTKCGWASVAHCREG